MCVSVLGEEALCMCVGEFLYVRVFGEEGGFLCMCDFFYVDWFLWVCVWVWVSEWVKAKMSKHVCVYVHGCFFMYVSFNVYVFLQELHTQTTPPPLHHFTRMKWQRPNCVSVVFWDRWWSCMNAGVPCIRPMMTPSTSSRATKMRLLLRYGWEEKGLNECGKEEWGDGCGGWRVCVCVVQGMSRFVVDGFVCRMNGWIVNRCVSAVGG